jgi:hypothetical protein
MRVLHASALHNRHFVLERPARALFLDHLAAVFDAVDADSDSALAAGQM